MKGVLLVASVAIVMIVAERIFPGRNWPRVKNWWPRAIAFNLIQVGFVWLAGVAWDGWMVRHQPWSAESLGLWPGALLGYLVITFVYYWWHRWRHQSNFLWRTLHQLHHSPQRIEVITSFYKHPAEFLANGLLSSAIVYLIVGLGPEAASLTVALTGLAELFYHWNVKTPHWVGYLVQRPESHCIHHEEGLHSFNYADLPLWDMLFGTFRNPVRWEHRCGFGADEYRWREMLMTRNLSAPEPSAESSG